MKTVRTTLELMLRRLAKTQIWLLQNRYEDYSVVASREIQVSLLMDDIRATMAGNVIKFPVRVRPVPQPPQPPQPPRAA